MISKEQKYEKIKFIRGGNWSDSYYTDYNGKLYNGSTGSVYIESFIEDINLDADFLDYHPDLVYWTNGVTLNVQDLYPHKFDYFEEIPKWTYSKDYRKPLIPQLNEEELFEFSKYNFSGKYERRSNSKYI